MLHRSVGFLIISLCLWRVTQAEIFEECGEKSNVYVATSQGCSKYILCAGEESSMGECEADTPYFSEADQTCDTQSSVCKGNEPAAPGSNSTVASPEIPSTTNATESSITTSAANVTLTNSATTTVTTASVTSAPVTIAPVTIASVTTTTVLSASVSTTPISSTSDSTSPVSVTPVSSTSVSTTTPIIISSSDSTTISSGTVPTSTAATNVSSHCPATDDPSAIVFLPHTTSCSSYFMCYHGEPVSMHCSNMLHFDPKSQKCDYPENVKCQLDSASPREKCHVHTIDSYPYPANCNYYYICRFGYLMVMQCPLNMDWDNEKKVCTLSGRAKCYHHHTGVEITI